MLGAIVGDVVGSIYEFNNHRSKDFELFGKGCFATDDSIMTLAVAKAVLESKDSGYNSDVLAANAVKYMHEIGRPYPNCGYGGRFADWMYSNDPHPYNSFGNGAAMRVSPVAYAAPTMEDCARMSKAVTAVTHNHPAGILGAEATACAVWAALHKWTKDEICELMERYYDLDFTIDEIRPTYYFNETCQDTVPQAFVAFLEADNFEDTVRTAISVGGDSDTLAAIACSIAGAYYGIPETISEKAYSYLDNRLKAILYEFESTYCPSTK